MSDSRSLIHFASTPLFAVFTYEKAVYVLSVIFAHLSIPSRKMVRCKIFPSSQKQLLQPRALLTMGEKCVILLKITFKE